MKLLIILLTSTILTLEAQASNHYFEKTLLERDNIRIVRTIDPLDETDTSCILYINTFYREPGRALLPKSFRIEMEYWTYIPGEQTLYLRQPSVFGHRWKRSGAGAEVNSIKIRIDRGDTYTLNVDQIQPYDPEKEEASKLVFQTSSKIFRDILGGNFLMIQYGDARTYVTDVSSISSHISLADKVCLDRQS